MRLVRWIAVGLLGLVLAWLAAAASAQAPTGQITGRVTDDNGAGIANIVVAAAPVSSPDSFTQTTTDATGSYSLTLPPGDYDVAFNTQDPVNDTYNGVTFGGPGAVCTICGGQAVTVTAGGVTANIGAALTTGTPPQTGTIRALSGKAIKIHGARLTFNFGCHVEPTGCIGTARLRFAPNGPTIATVHVVVDPNRIGRLVFDVPASIRARVRRTHRHSVAALVEVTTPPGHFITHFRLVDR